MQCHSGKKIKGRVCAGVLQTKRTLTEPDGTVRRERFCPDCQTQQWTIERFEIDIKAESDKTNKEIQKSQRQLWETQQELAEIKKTGKHFIALLQM